MELLGESTLFIEFMLKVILETIDNLPQKKITDIFNDKIIDILSSKEERLFLEAIVPYLQKSEEISNFKAQILTNKSAESIKRFFRKFTEAGLLIAVGENKGRVYKLNKDFLKKHN